METNQDQQHHHSVLQYQSKTAFTYMFQGFIKSAYFVKNDHLHNPAVLAFLNLGHGKTLRALKEPDKTCSLLVLLVEYHWFHYLVGQHGNVCTYSCICNVSMVLLRTADVYSQIGDTFFNSLIKLRQAAEQHAKTHCSSHNSIIIIVSSGGRGRFP